MRFVRHTVGIARVIVRAADVIGVDRRRTESAIASPPPKKLHAEETARLFGENLRRLRKAAGYSQEQLAVAASLHRTEIGLIERGRRVVRVDTLIRLAGALGIPSRKLLEGLESERP